ncbi:sulfatase-like hydrolase/transferase [Salegentibacter sp. LM13S]|uniref:sulfatase-like hydrolase/transferase n=1 Tax=Salegentibacter lacus TaxID=2873599 RepID=UPI001CCBD472|nr:sulfatase-like hydrolase/transferase [Salegentibacter lacus]MBZ9630066.1 sulfatase-like hydrolase/transferase [Salegentibacter lacus]
MNYFNIQRWVLFLPVRMFSKVFSNIDYSEIKFRFTAFFVVLVSIISLSCKEEENKTEKDNIPPNFLVIIADDAGWNDFSYHGSRIQTPIIDSLAENGLKLERFYAAPTCSPSRASLLTGKPASRMGIVAPISGRSELSLPDSITTLPQALKEKNYKTSLFGKWHLGLKPESGPQAYGFDYSYGFLHGQIDQYTHQYKNGDSSWYRNKEFIEEEGHATDLITNEAIKWLEEEKTDTPFFMQVAYSAPHFPLQEEEKWKQPYNGVFDDPTRRDYAAAMAHMDHSIGKLLKALKEKGLEENTVIVFLSDNGAMENWYPDDQYNGKFEPHTEMGSNLPLREWKNSNYEGAIRVPAIISWKGNLSSGTSEEYISVSDLMPTFLELAGVEKIPESIEGQNAWPVLTGENQLWKNKIYIRGHLQESLIQKPWKLIRTRYLEEPSVHELYNIEDDPEEKHNILEGNSDIFDNLKNDLEAEFAKDAPEVNLDLIQ